MAGRHSNLRVEAEHGRNPDPGGRLGLVLIATLPSIWLRIATALSEIVVGTIARLLIGALVGGASLGADAAALLPPLR